MTHQQTSFMHLIPCKTQISSYWLHDWLTIVVCWLSLDLDLIASTYEALDSHSAAYCAFKCQTVLERVWTGAPLWPTLECCGYTGKLPSVNVTQILERIWHPGDIKGKKMTLWPFRCLCFCGCKKIQKAARLGWNSQASETSAFFQSIICYCWQQVK